MTHVIILTGERRSDGVPAVATLASRRGRRGELFGRRSRCRDDTAQVQEPQPSRRVQAKSAASSYSAGHRLEGAGFLEHQVHGRRLHQGETHTDHQFQARGGLIKNIQQLSQLF